MKDKYQIIAIGNRYKVTDREGNVAATASTRASAESCCTRLNYEERITERPCITYKRKFRSEGAHNRMCTRCRITAKSYSDFEVAL